MEESNKMEESNNGSMSRILDVKSDLEDIVRNGSHRREGMEAYRGVEAHDATIVHGERPYVFLRVKSTSPSDADNYETGFLITEMDGKTYIAIDDRICSANEPRGYESFGDVISKVRSYAAKNGRINYQNAIVHTPLERYLLEKPEEKVESGLLDAVSSHDQDTGSDRSEIMSGPKEVAYSSADAGSDRSEIMSRLREVAYSSADAVSSHDQDVEVQDVKIVDKDTPYAFFKISAGRDGRKYDMGVLIAEMDGRMHIGTDDGFGSAGSSLAALSLFDPARSSIKSYAKGNGISYQNVIMHTPLGELV